MSVIIAVTTETEAAAMVGWGWQFARARHLDVTVVIPLRGSDEHVTDIDLALQPGDGENTIVAAVRQAVSALPEASLPVAPTDETEHEVNLAPEFSLKLIRSPKPYEAVLDVLKVVDAHLLLVAKVKVEDGRNEEMSLIQQLFKRAPCDTMLIRPGDADPLKCRRILIPAAGGPHAIRAIQWGAQVAMENDGLLSPMFIESEMGALAEDVGHEHLRRILAEASVEESAWVKPKVVVSSDVGGSIVAAVEEDYDLMLVGASDRGAVHRMLFGTVPDHLLSGPEAVAVGAMRRARPLITRFREGMEAWLDLRVPQLTREARIELFERLQTGSRWNFDFLALMALSTSIAALGLIQNSTAVVIGAMLVAPLMMPLIGAGLALVQGNEVLMRTSIRSIFYGFFLALLIGIMCGAVSPVRELTSELAARGAPTLLDLGVALFSGIAAAYALARPNLSAALPGVAIAAALVPPLATVGISLAFGEFRNATGAATLFATNGVIIILAAAATFYACGIRMFNQSRSATMWVQRFVLGLVLIAALLSVPLTSVLWERVAAKRDPMHVPNTLIAEVADYVEEYPGTELVAHRVTRSGNDIVLVFTVRAPNPASSVMVDAIAATVRETLKRQVRVQVKTELVAERGQ
jgi:uncharacterized hydrophobic protein (TIGR00271 family)